MTVYDEGAGLPDDCRMYQATDLATAVPPIAYRACPRYGDGRGS